jgi:chorismate synthase
LAIRYLTAGESHGKGLTVVLEGFPSRIPLTAAEIDVQLARRQMGHGRGARMRIEQDRVRILSGVRHGLTLGSPIALFIENLDYATWEPLMRPEPPAVPGRALTRPRPGHADLSGGLKYDQKDLRNVLERSSARETAARVAAGSVARKLLSLVGITVQSHVVRIGSVSSEVSLLDLKRLNDCADASPVRMLNPESERKAVRLIDEATRKGDTLGGVFEVVAAGVPPGLGSHVQWDRRLDGRLAQALMSMQAIKGVEIGRGFELAAQPGSKVHDAIGHSSRRGFFRYTNRAGGLEGGMTNGEPVVVRAAQKPIATLRKPLPSVDILTKKKSTAGYERSDICAVPAGSVIGEALCAWTLADALMEKMGGDHLGEVLARCRAYRSHLQGY